MLAELCNLRLIDYTLSGNIKMHTDTEQSDYVYRMSDYKVAKTLKLVFGFAKTMSESEAESSR